MWIMLLLGQYLGRFTMGCSPKPNSIWKMWKIRVVFILPENSSFAGTILRDGYRAAPFVGGMGA